MSQPNHPFAELSPQFDPTAVRPSKVNALIIGCGNILCGDDAAGPILIRRMWEKGLPAGVNCADGGTGGMDVAFQMRSVPHVILVDACQSESEPGAIFQVPGEELEQLPPTTGINLHSFRWDHALAFGRWLLKEDYPQKVTVFLIEGKHFGVGDELSPAVDQAIDQLVQRIFDLCQQTNLQTDAEDSVLTVAEGSDESDDESSVKSDDEGSVESDSSTVIEIDAESYLRISKEASLRFFPEDSLVPLWKDGDLYLLPTRGAAAGGLMLKQRNPQGDRSLLINEVFQFEPPMGKFLALWDEQLCGLKIVMVLPKQPLGIYGSLAANLLLPPVPVRRDNNPVAHVGRDNNPVLPTDQPIPARRDCNPVPQADQPTAAGRDCYPALPIPPEIALQNLLRGDLNSLLPPDWEFFRDAAHGLIDEAERRLRQMLSSPAAENSLYRDICRYNLFALRPDADRLVELESRLTEPLLTLLQLIAFSVGLREELPSHYQNLKGEQLAWALAVAATSDIETENFVAAREKLATAVDSAREASPLLAAILMAQSASVAQSCLGLPAALVKQEYEAALKLASEFQLPGFVGELWTQIGMLLQQAAGNSRGGLLEAIKAYQSALQAGIEPTTNPILFAELQNNLGLAYVSMANAETSNQLRYGIAIQSFRKGLEVIDSQKHAELWARINMNLASALQYAPSSHPSDNLAQAVEIYEQVLTVRTKARDPVAYALVLLNQANALAHLGIFKHALEKAAEAYKLFQWYDRAEQATAARELVEEVNLKLEIKGSQNGSL